MNQRPGQELERTNRI